jgi:hypothetical protein
MGETEKIDQASILILVKPSTAAFAGYTFGVLALVAAFVDNLTAAAALVAVSFLCFVVAVVSRQERKTHCADCGAPLETVNVGQTACSEHEYH